MQRAGGATLRGVARLAAEHAALAGGVRAHPAVAAVLDDAEGPAGGLDALARDLKQQGHGAPFRAVEAARACTSPSALAAAFHAVAEAQLAVRATRTDPRALRDAVLTALGSPEPPSGSGGLTGATWLDDHWLAWAGCATYVRGLDAAGVAAALGAEPDAAGPGPVALSTRPVAWFRTFGAWVVVLEPNPRPRPADPLLERLSAAGAAVRAEWSTTGNVWFRHAAGGQVRTRFNGYAPEQVWGTHPHALDELIAGLPIPRPDADGGAQAAGLLALAARLTGVELTAAALDEPWRPHPST